MRFDDPIAQAILRAMQAMEVHHGLPFTHDSGEADVLDFSGAHAALAQALAALCPDALRCLPVGGPEDSLGAIARRAAGLALLADPGV
jgi:hypothetical protein